MNTFLFAILIITLLSSLITGINSESLIFEPESSELNGLPKPKEYRRRSRERQGFSFFREFFEPLPGVINDVFPAPTPHDPIVEIRNGFLHGTIKNSRDGRKYLAFLGVPYAQPPIGRLRFEPPQKLKTRWPGIRDAGRFGSACMHLDVFFTGKLRGKEDCLFANIYTPRLDSNLKVLVVVHGGGFFSGSGDFFQAKYFMDEDIVVVVFNYRLAALGFLNTGRDGVHGNQGLKDQVLMLQWVQENIHSFGGDPNQVTLYGDSAGGASVGYHILSPLSKGLFHKAIATSGTPFSPWALSKNPIESAKNLGRTVGCPTNDSQAMVDCLKSVSPRDISKGYRGLMDAISIPADFFAPSVEDILTNHTMLSRHPEDILKEGTFNKVPLMLGLSKNEGLLFSSRIMADKYVKRNFGKRWNEWIPTLLSYDPRNITISDKLRSNYFPSLNGNLNLSRKKNFLNLTNLLSDGEFFHPSNRFAKLIMKHAPVYRSYLSYQGRFTVHDVFMNVPMLSENDDQIPEVALGTGLFSDLLKFSLTNERPSEFGAGHGDIAMLLFNNKGTPGIGRFSMDYIMSKALIKSFVDFANSKDVSFDGVPWPEVSQSENMKYMQLDVPGRVINEPFKERMKCWDGIQ